MPEETVAVESLPEETVAVGSLPEERTCQDDGGDIVGTTCENEVTKTIS